MYSEPRRLPHLTQILFSIVSRFGNSEADCSWFYSPAGQPEWEFRPLGVYRDIKGVFSLYIYSRINWTAQNIIFCVRLSLAKLFAFSWLDFPPMTAKYQKLHIRNNPIDHPRLKQPFISCPLGLLSDTLCPALLSFPAVCVEIFKSTHIQTNQLWSDTVVAQ